MGQSKPFRAKALIVEDDPMQRAMIGLLLEESDFDVIECESAEAAELVLQRHIGGLVKRNALRHAHSNDYRSAVHGEPVLRRRPNGAHDRRRRPHY